VATRTPTREIGSPCPLSSEDLGRLITVLACIVRVYMTSQSTGFQSWGYAIDPTTGLLLAHIAGLSDSETLFRV
jgi:hypothetical protein